jgi:hypothetical protein
MGMAKRQELEPIPLRSVISALGAFMTNSLLTERCVVVGQVLGAVVVVALAVAGALVVAWLHGGKIPRM